MSIQEFVNSNQPFYHVTSMSNVDSILKNGIKKGRLNAICVVRSMENSILDEVIRQINVSGEKYFAVIRILPQKHNVIADIVCEDTVDEPTAPLQNYIVKDVIKIKEEDIIIKDYEAKFKNCLEDKSIVKLTGYILPGRPENNDSLLMTFDENDYK